MGFSNKTTVKKRTCKMMVSSWLPVGYYIVKNIYMYFEFRKKKEIMILILVLLCSQYNRW